VFCCCFVVVSSAATAAARFPGRLLCRSSNSGHDCPTEKPQAESSVSRTSSSLVESTAGLTNSSTLSQSQPDVVSSECPIIALEKNRTSLHQTIHHLFPPARSRSLITFAKQIFLDYSTSDHPSIPKETSSSSSSSSSYRQKLLHAKY
jgi:hypothetical protein